MVATTGTKSRLWATNSSQFSQVHQSMQLSNTPTEPLDYLVIAAHPDDAELGLGGTIATLKSRGARVGVLDLTNGEPTPFGTPEIRARETAAATAALELDWRGNLGLPNRALVADLNPRRQLAGAL